MAGGVSRYSTADGPSGGRKRKGETPTEEFDAGSTVSRPSRRVQELVDRCCSCTQHSTCSTTGLPAHVCKYCNAVRKCKGCYCWGKCRNKGRVMPSPTTSRGLLSIFPQGADLPATDPSATTPPVLLPTYFSLQAISAARVGGRGVRGRASGRKSPRLVEKYSIGLAMWWETA